MKENKTGDDIYSELCDISTYKTPEPTQEDIDKIFAERNGLLDDNARAR